MADIDGQTSDLIKQVDNRNADYVVFEGTATLPAPLDITYSTGYGAYIEVPISELNFGIQVPEVSAVQYSEISLGGGVTQYDHDTLPFVKWDTNGNVSEAAYLKVYYQALTKTDPTEATSKLVIWYYNRTSSTGGKTFYYKIRSIDVLPQS